MLNYLAYRPIHLHLIFEISSSKNVVQRTGVFVYFELDVCRLHRQEKSSLKQAKSPVLDFLN